MLNLKKLLIINGAIQSRLYLALKLLTEKVYLEQKQASNTKPSLDKRINERALINSDY